MRPNKGGGDLVLTPLTFKLNCEPFPPKKGKNLIANYSLISLSIKRKFW